MGFKITKSGRPERKEGHYVLKDGVEHYVEAISINNSGKVCIRLRDIHRKTSELIQVCDLANLTGLINGVTETYAE